MISIEEAQNIIFSHINTLPGESIKLDQALDRVLSEDIYAEDNVPLLDNSAMDGYAIKINDTHGATKDTPKTLEVIDDLRAGFVSSETIDNNQAIRIMTGAPIPEGAEAVVMVENTRVKGQGSGAKGKKTDLIEIYKEVERGENIRKAGEDIKSGERVLSKGTRLGPAHIGVLASLGKAKVSVTRKPKVAILATGDEVIDVDEKLTPGKLRNANTYAVSGQVIRSGGIVKDLGIAKDDKNQLRKRIKKGIDCDIILTSGGVSVGDYDLVKLVLSEMGTDIKFWKVAMKPGKPLVFGTIGETIVFGLPGNPVSGMVSFEVFVKPAIFKMIGRNIDNTKTKITAILEEDIKKKKGRRHFIRAQTRWAGGRYVTRTTGPQGSGILKSMILANSLIVMPEEIESVKKGEEVKVKFLH